MGLIGGAAALSGGVCWRPLAAGFWPSACVGQPAAAVLKPGRVVATRWRERRLAGSPSRPSRAGALVRPVCSHAFSAGSSWHRSSRFDVGIRSRAGSGERAEKRCERGGGG